MSPQGPFAGTRRAALPALSTGDGTVHPVAAPGSWIPRTFFHVFEIAELVELQRSLGADVHARLAA